MIIDPAASTSFTGAEAEWRPFYEACAEAIAQSSVVLRDKTVLRGAIGNYELLKQRTVYSLYMQHPDAVDRLLNQNFRPGVADNISKRLREGFACITKDDGGQSIEKAVSAIADVSHVIDLLPILTTLETEYDRITPIDWHSHPLHVGENDDCVYAISDKYRLVDSEKIAVKLR